MHGDALCTDDHAYQRLRATVRDADWQRRFLALSIAARRALAGAARAGSQAHTAAMEHAITDVNADSVAAALRGAGTSTFCCTAIRIGRACMPSRWTGAPRTRIVLGDWYRSGQRAALGSRAAPSFIAAALSGAAPLSRERPNESETAHRGSLIRLRLERAKAAIRAATSMSGSQRARCRARARDTA